MLFFVFFSGVNNSDKDLNNIYYLIIFECLLYILKLGIYYLIYINFFGS